MIYRTQGRDPEPADFHTCPASDPGPDALTTEGECRACFPLRAPVPTDEKGAA